MAVTVDNTGASNGSVVGVSSLDITSFTVGSISNGILIVKVCFYKSTSDTTIDLVNSKWNGSQTFTKFDELSGAMEGGFRHIIWLYILNPSAATGTIHIVLNTSVDELVIGATSWSNVDQTTPFGTSVKTTNSTGTATTSVIVSSTVGNVVIDAVCGDAHSDSSLFTANQTIRWNQQAAIGTSEGGSQSASGTGSNITCTWTMGSGTDSVQMGAEIKAFSGGGSSPTLPQLERKTRGLNRGMYQAA